MLIDITPMPENDTFTIDTSGNTATGVQYRFIASEYATTKLGYFVNFNAQMNAASATTLEFTGWDNPLYTSIYTISAYVYDQTKLVQTFDFTTDAANFTPHALGTFTAVSASGASTNYANSLIDYTITIVAAADYTADRSVPTGGIIELVFNGNFVDVSPRCEVTNTSHDRNNKSGFFQCWRTTTNTLHIATLNAFDDSNTLVVRAFAQNPTATSSSDTITATVYKSPSAMTTSDISQQLILPVAITTHATIKAPTVLTVPYWIQSETNYPARVDTSNLERVPIKFSLTLPAGITLSKHTANTRGDYIEFEFEAIWDGATAGNFGLDNATGTAASFQCFWKELSGSLRTFMAHTCVASSAT